MAAVAVAAVMARHGAACGLPPHRDGAGGRGNGVPVLSPAVLLLLLVLEPAALPPGTSSPSPSTSGYHKSSPGLGSPQNSAPPSAHCQRWPRPKS